MGELLAITYFLITLLTIRDVVGKLRGDVERVLWVIAVVALPLFGPAFWYYVQYIAPGEKRRAKRRRVRRGEEGGNLK